MSYFKIDFSIVKNSAGYELTKDGGINARISPLLKLPYKAKDDGFFEIHTASFDDSDGKCTRIH